VVFGDIPVHDHVTLRFLFWRTPNLSSELGASRSSSSSLSLRTTLLYPEQVSRSDQLIFNSVPQTRCCGRNNDESTTDNLRRPSDLFCSSTPHDNFFRHAYTNPTRSIALSLTVPTTCASPIADSDRDNPCRTSPSQLYNLNIKLTQTTHSSHSGPLSPSAHISSSSSATASSHSTMSQPRTQS
jgi:hypothetical protein